MNKAHVVNIGVMETSFLCQGLEDSHALAWLENSWRHPHTFWKGLLAAQDALVPGQRKSMAFQYYDFFHDLALRFARSTSPALLQPAGKKGEGVVLSYASLSYRAAALATRWKQSGARPGQLVALIVLPGMAMAITMLAAFRLGLVISLLPPQGRAFLHRRLTVLQPDFVVIDPLHSSLLGRDRPPLLDWEEGGAVADMTASSAVYPSGNTVALLFDLCSPASLLPYPISADTLYLGAVRDGLLSLSLRPGECYAAPGFNPMESQPSLLLAGLVNNATWLELSLAELVEHPDQLVSRPLKILGISRGLRDFLLKRPLKLTDITSHWFRHPGETIDLNPWQRCVEQVGLTNAYAANLAWNTTLGGCYLCSPKRLALVHQHALPAAGCPWQLGQMPDGVVPSVNNVGLLTLFFPTGKETGEGQEPQPGRMAPVILSQQGAQWFCVRSPRCGKNGLYYPADEVRDAATTALPGWMSCGLVTVPASGVQDDPQQVVLVFTAAAEAKGKLEIDRAQVIALIQQALRRDMGPGFMPNQVVFIPLYPRFDEAGAVDGLWCAEQYLTGRLQRKAKNQVFRILAQMQGVVG